MDKPLIFHIQLQDSIIFPYIEFKNRHSDAKRIYKFPSDGKVFWKNLDDVYGGDKIEFSTDKRLVRLFEDGNIEMYE